LILADVIYEEEVDYAETELITQGKPRFLKLRRTYSLSDLMTNANDTMTKIRPPETEPTPDKLYRGEILPGKSMGLNNPYTNPSS